MHGPATKKKPIISMIDLIIHGPFFFMDYTPRSILGMLFFVQNSFQAFWKLLTIFLSTQYLSLPRLIFFQCFVVMFWALTVWKFNSIRGFVNTSSNSRLRSKPRNPMTVRKVFQPINLNYSLLTCSVRSK